MSAISGSNINYSTTGLILNTTNGPSPTQTPSELLSTRAVESRDGWLGQVVMSGEIVYETKPQETSAAALRKVNARIHRAFKQLIVGV